MTPPPHTHCNTPPSHCITPTLVHCTPSLPCHPSLQGSSSLHPGPLHCNPPTFTAVLLIPLAPALPCPGPPPPYHSLCMAAGTRKGPSGLQEERCRRAQGKQQRPLKNTWTLDWRYGELGGGGVRDSQGVRPVLPGDPEASRQGSQHQSQALQATWLCRGAREHCLDGCDGQTSGIQRSTVVWDRYRGGRRAAGRRWALEEGEWCYEAGGW